MKQRLLIILLFFPVVGTMASVAFRTNGNGTPKSVAAAQQVLTLNGAVQFGEDHAFTQTARKFEELVKKYYGKPINFELYVNSELGLEKDYFAYMSHGIAVDYAIVTPAHMSTFSESAPLVDMAFLFRDVDHWNKVLDSDALDPLES